MKFKHFGIFLCFPALILSLGLFGCTHLTPAPPASIAPSSKVPIPQNLQSGDLLFLHLECDLCDAIETVTKEQFSVSGPALSHVGIVSIESGITGGIYLYEAWPDGGVRKTRIEEVLSRIPDSKHLMVAHFKPEFRSIAKRAVTRAATHLGARYNSSFLPDNGEFYCSELVYDSYRDKKGNPIFLMKPMFFGTSPEKAFQTWKRYFEERKIKEPEGLPGISPLGIYLQGRSKFFN